jgi:hypothetical protein
MQRRGPRTTLQPHRWNAADIAIAIEHVVVFMLPVAAFAGDAGAAEVQLHAPETDPISAAFSNPGTPMRPRHGPAKST